MTVPEFIAAVHILGLKYNASVTSWLRSDAHNRAVGGVPHSAHRFGLACDFTYDAPVDVVAITEDARRLGLRVLREKDHDHVQPLTWEAN